MALRVGALSPWLSTRLRRGVPCHAVATWSARVPEEHALPSDAKLHGKQKPPRLCVRPGEIAADCYIDKYAALLFSHSRRNGDDACHRVWCIGSGSRQSTARWDRRTNQGRSWSAPRPTASAGRAAPCLRQQDRHGATPGEARILIPPTREMLPDAKPERSCRLGGILAVQKFGLHFQPNFGGWLRPPADGDLAVLAFGLHLQPELRC